MSSQPIPPPKLVESWADEIYHITEDDDQRDLHVATRASHWAANIELEACCEWVAKTGGERAGDALRTHRRRQALDLKEQALVALNAIAVGANNFKEFYEDIETIRKALESLSNWD